MATKRKTKKQDEVVTAEGQVEAPVEEKAQEVDTPAPADETKEELAQEPTAEDKQDLPEWLTDVEPDSDKEQPREYDRHFVGDIRAIQDNAHSAGMVEAYERAESATAKLAMSILWREDGDEADEIALELRNMSNALGKVAKGLKDDVIAKQDHDQKIADYWRGKLGIDNQGPIAGFGDDDSKDDDSEEYDGGMIFGMGVEVTDDGPKMTIREVAGSGHLEGLAEMFKEVIEAKGGEMTMNDLLEMHAKINQDRGGDSGGFQLPFNLADMMH